MRIQKRGKEPRRRLSPRVEGKIERETERLARKFKCSKSFVIATALADQYGIRIDDRYDN